MIVCTSDDRQAAVPFVVNIFSAPFFVAFSAQEIGGRSGLMLRQSGIVPGLEGAEFGVGATMWFIHSFKSATLFIELAIS